MGEKVVYGIPVPRGVRKDWEATSMERKGAGEYLRRRLVVPEWGDPTNCVAWFDRFGRLRACVGHYANGRQALVRVDANGNYRTIFSNAPSDSGRLPKGEAGTAECEASQSGPEGASPKGPSHA